MKNIVSKELLKEVLRFNIDYIAEQEDTHISWHDEMGGHIINIYELAHKCKEWLESNCFYEIMIVENYVYLMQNIWGEGGAYYEHYFSSEKEWYLNIFKACQWRINNKDK